MDYLVTKGEYKADAAKKGWFEGYFSIFKNLDDGGDIILPGAFTKTLAERGPRVQLFMGHDWSKLIGPPPASIDGGVLAEDEKGLFARGRLTLGSFWGNEAWALISDGALKEGSIGYMSIPDKTDFEELGDELARVLREVKLYEISPVPLGMNPLTTIEAMKAMMADLLRPNTNGNSTKDALPLVERLGVSVDTMIEQIGAGEMLVTATPDQVKRVVDSLRSCMGLLEPLAKESADKPDAALAASHLALMQAKARAIDLSLRMS